MEYGWLRENLKTEQDEPPSPFEMHKSDYASPDGRPRIEAKNTLQDLKSIGTIHTLPNVSVYQKLLELCFNRMNPHIWYRLLPLDIMKCDDFAFSVGQSWDLIQPLLIHLGYLFEVGEELKLNVDRFANLQHVNLGNDKFHMSNTHLKGDTKNYFFVLVNHILVGQKNN